MPHDVDLPIPPAALPSHGTLMLGDLHGTREIPAFVGRVLTTVSAREPVVFALEITRDNAPSLQTFLASDGGPAARSALLAKPWWQNRDQQDGRRSVAMLALVETVRQLRHAGRDVELVAIDAEGANAEEREETMARHVIEARRMRADAALIVYAGNLHTRKSEVAFKPGFAWMAMRVEKAGIDVVSLNARWADGTAWICRGSTAASCGVAFVGGSSAKPGIHLDPSDGYDGVFGVGALTASPPAGLPDLAADVDRRIAEAPRTAAAVSVRARREYDAGRFEACAALLSTIAAPDADVAYDHACCLARAGRKDEALERLTFALAAGFSDLAHVEKDTDLASLRDDPRWPLREQTSEVR